MPLDLRSVLHQFPPGTSANANVNIVPMGGGQVALTETPIAVQFDPRTLETVGLTDYADDLRGQVTTAHPHQDLRTGDLINYLLRFGRRSEYQVCRQRSGGITRELIGSVPTGQPGYLHSFAITEDYVVLAVFPFVVNPLSLLRRARPFIENYRWRPELGTRFVVLNLADGLLRGEYTTDAFFAFHHINAYVAGGGRQLVSGLDDH